MAGLLDLIASPRNYGGTGAYSAGAKEARDNKLSNLMIKSKMQETRTADSVREGSAVLDALGEDFSSDKVTDDERQQRWSAAKQGLGKYFDLSDMPDQVDLNAFGAIRSLVSSHGGGGGGGETANIQDHKYYLSLDEKGRQEYLDRQRETKFLDKGSFFVNTRSGEEIEKGLKPTETIDYKTKVAETESDVTKGATGGIELERDAAQLYSEIQNDARQASTMMPRLEKLKTLAGDVDTGRFAGAKLYAAELFGLDVANEQELNAKLMGLAQDILSQQTGSKTDFEFEVSVKQAASMDKTPESNKRLINALITRNEEAIALGDQAKIAYEKGAKSLLELRFTPPSATPKQDYQQRAKDHIEQKGVSNLSDADRAELDELRRRHTR